MKTIWRNRNVILSILAVIIGIIYISNLRSENERLKAYLPHMLIGDKINYFDLVSTDAVEIDASVVNDKKDKISAIFLFFGSSCSSCSGMFPIWNRIGKLSGQSNLDVYGILLDSIENTIRFSEEMSVNFELYAPQDLKKIRSALKIKYEQPQTILYKNRQIIYLKLGQLDKEDFLHIQGLIKGEEK